MRIYIPYTDVYLYKCGDAVSCVGVRACMCMHIMYFYTVYIIIIITCIIVSVILCYATLHNVYMHTPLHSSDYRKQTFQACAVASVSSLRSSNSSITWMHTYPGCGWKTLKCIARPQMSIVSFNTICYILYLTCMSILT